MKTTIPTTLVVVALGLAGCGGGTSIPSTNVRDYHVAFSTAEASESCPQAIQDDAEAHSEFTLTYRIHWVDGPDEARVDLYWKARGDADSSYAFFAAGTLEGTLDDGAINYAGGAYEEDRSGARVTYRVEGRARLRFSDEIPDSTEDYVIEDSTATAEFPIGCVYTLHYNGDLASEQDVD